MDRKSDYAASGKKQSAKKLIALAVCAVIVAGCVLSAAFVFTHANHEHDCQGPGGSCAVCVHLAAAGNLLKSVCAAFVGAALVSGCLCAVLHLLKHVGFHTGFITPVHLKVRINN